VKIPTKKRTKNSFERKKERRGRRDALEEENGEDKGRRRCKSRRRRRRAKRRERRERGMSRHRRLAVVVVVWGDPGAAKAPPNNRRAFAQRNPIGRLHAQTHHAANDALTNGKPGKVPARHVPMLAARAPGLQGETIVVVVYAGGIFSSFGLFASEMFPIIFIFFLYLSFPSLQREKRSFKRQRKKKRALLLLCAKEDKEEEDKEEGRPPGRLFLSLSHAKG